MLIVNIFLLLLIGNAASRISLKEMVEEFTDFHGPLKQAGHLKERTLSEFEAEALDPKHFGVVLDIQNYSPLRLVDPAVYIKGGWGHPKFSQLHQINQTSRDAFAFHNWWRSKVENWHSSGVVSWLLLKPDGSRYTKIVDGQEVEIRLWIYWENTNWYCTDHEPGLVAVDFLGNFRDEQQSITEEPSGGRKLRKEESYFDKLERRKEESKSTAERHRDLMVEVEMENKCNPVVTVKLASKRYKSHKVGLFQSEPSVSLGGANASFWFYLLIGLVVLAAVALCCCCYTGVRTLLRRGREARYGEKQRSSQGGIYTGVPTDEPDREAFSEGEQEVDTLLKEPEKPKVARGGRQDDSVEK